MADIFISYAGEDRTRAKILADILRRHGWTVWWDRTIPPGRSFDEVIEEALGSARCVMVLWSKASVESNWVKEEADIGLNRKVLVPALLDVVEIPLGFRRVQAADLTDWQGEDSHPELEKLFGSIMVYAPLTGATAVISESSAPVSGSARSRRHQPMGTWRRVAVSGGVLIALAAGIAGWFATQSYVDVPSAIGKSENQGRVLLGNAQLVVGSVREKSTDEADPGSVIAQEPLPGSRVKKGARVDLTVATRPTPAVSKSDSKGLEEALRNLPLATGLGMQGMAATAFYRSDLGLHIAFLEALGGAVVWQVDGEPARKAGFHTLDIVLEIDGQKIVTKDDLRRAFDGIRPGTSRFLVKRDNNKMITEVAVPAGLTTKE